MKIYLTDIRKASKDLLKQYENVLTPLEKKRFLKMTNNTRRLQFLVGRALIKDICYESPTILKSGKPVIQEGYISLAHSGSFVVLAVSKEPIGIDIEDASKEKDFDQLGKRLNFNLKGDQKKSFYKAFTFYEASYKMGVKAQKIYARYYDYRGFLICLVSNKKERISILKGNPFEAKKVFQIKSLKGRKYENL